MEKGSERRFLRRNEGQKGRFLKGEEEVVEEEAEGWVEEEEEVLKPKLGFEFRPSASSSLPYFQPFSSPPVCECVCDGSEGGKEGGS